MDRHRLYHAGINPGRRGQTEAFLFFILFFVSSLSICSCSNSADPKKTEAQNTQPIIKEAAKNISTLPPSGAEDLSLLLEGIAEIERSGVYYPGLALTESGVREKAGDYAGAVIALYKELSRAYAFGEIDSDELRKTLENTMTLFGENGTFDKSKKDAAIAAVRGVIAFSSGEWEKAEEDLRGLLGDEEPDSFLRWMLLVCSLEKQNSDAFPNTKDRAAYGAIRARYSTFPEYWLRGARAYSAEAPLFSPSLSNFPPGESIISGNISGIYAEQCINLSPAGPFARECRLIIARGEAITEGGEAIKSKLEIEETARRAASTGNPALLSELLPIIALPDNRYTNYAVGILKSLCSIQGFRNYFEEEAASAAGRLAERLRYISRG